jgi:hypothetical protein
MSRTALRARTQRVGSARFAGRERADDRIVEGRIVYVNKAGQLLGKPSSEILGRSLGDVIELVDEGDRKSLGDPVRQTLTTGARVNVGPARHARLGRRATASGRSS